MKVFYMVLRNPESPCSMSPKARFKTEREAMQEAERLCVKERDMFYILKAISSCELTTVSWRILENE